MSLTTSFKKRQCHHDMIKAHAMKFTRPTCNNAVNMRGYYNINVLRQTALVVNPITVDNFVFLFTCTLKLYDGSDLKTYRWMRGLGPDVVSLVMPTGVL